MQEIRVTLTLQLIEVSPEPLDQRGIVLSFLLPAQGVAPLFLCSCVHGHYMTPFKGPLTQPRTKAYPGTEGKCPGYLGKGLTCQLGRDSHWGSWHFQGHWSKTIAYGLS